MAMEAESEAVTMLVAGDGLENKFAQVGVCSDSWQLHLGLGGVQVYHIPQWGCQVTQSSLYGSDGWCS
jgi:hypothetical protein